jgi:hypothetical protein
VAATGKAATASLRTKSGTDFSSDRIRQTTATALQRIAAAVAVALSVLPLLLIASPALAASNKVRITDLSDVDFGIIANLGVDAIRSQSVCLYADTNSNGYNVTASGTGPGGAFVLSSGPRTMTYEVQWSNSSGQGSGTQLASNVPLTGQVSGATHQTCSSGPATSASLIILLRSNVLSSATAGTYNGTLTLVVGAE